MKNGFVFEQAETTEPAGIGKRMKTTLPNRQSTKMWIVTDMILFEHGLYNARSPAEEKAKTVAEENLNTVQRVMETIVSYHCEYEGSKTVCIYDNASGVYNQETYEKTKSTGEGWHPTKMTNPLWLVTDVTETVRHLCANREEAEQTAKIMAAMHPRMIVHAMTTVSAYSSPARGQASLNVPLITSP